MKVFAKISLLCMVLLFVLGIIGATPVNALSNRQGALLEMNGEKALEIKGMARNEIIKKANHAILLLNIKNIGSPEYVYEVDGEKSSNHIKRYYKVLFNGDSYISFLEDGTIISSGGLDAKEPTADKNLREEIFGENYPVEIIDRQLKKEGYSVSLNKNYSNLKVYIYEKKLSEDKVDKCAVIYDKNNKNIVSISRYRETFSAKSTSERIDMGRYKVKYIPSESGDTIVKYTPGEVY